MGFQGSLASVNLGDIFQTLAMNRQTGTLVVHHAATTRSVWFDQGEIASCDGTDRDGGPLLLNVLSRRGILTPEQAQDVERRMYQNQQPARELLLADGVVPAGELDDISASCIEDQVCEIFEWADGDFEFIDGQPTDDLNSPEALDAGDIRLPTQSLVMEAMRRRDEWERIHEVIPDPDELFVVDAEGRANIRNLGDEHDPDMLKVLRHLDGRRSIDDIAETVGLPRFDTFAIVSQLVLGGVARPRAPQEVVDDALALRDQGEDELAASMLENAAKRGEHPEVLRPLAEMKLAAGDTPRAVELYLELIGRAQDDGDMDQALADLDVVIGINPDDPELRNDRAECLIDLGREGEAAQAFIDAAKAFLTSRSIPQALRCCHRAKDLDPAASEPHAILAKCHLADGQTESAVVEYKSLWHTLLSGNRPRKALDELTRILDRDCKFQHVKQQVLEHARGSEAVKTSSAMRILVYLLIVLALGAGGIAAWKFYEREVAHEGRRKAVTELTEQLRQAEEGPAFSLIDRRIGELKAATTDAELQRRLDQLREDLEAKRDDLAAVLLAEFEQAMAERRLADADALLGQLGDGFGLPRTRLATMRDQLADARSRASVGEDLATIARLWAEHHVDEAVERLDSLTRREGLTPTVRSEAEQQLAGYRAELASAEYLYRTGESLAAAGLDERAKEFYQRAENAAGDFYREEARKKLIAIEESITRQKIANIREAIAQNDPSQVFSLLADLRALVADAKGQFPAQALAALELPLMLTVDHHATRLAVRPAGGEERIIAAPADHRGAWRVELRYPATGSLTVTASRVGFRPATLEVSAARQRLAESIELERARSWELDLGARAVAVPVVAGDKVLMTTDDSRLHIVDTLTGRASSIAYDSFHTFSHRPVAHQGVAYLAIGDRVHAVGIATRERLWSFPREEGIDTLPLADHGLWVQEHQLIPGQTQIFTGSQPPGAIEDGSIVTIAVDAGEPTPYPATPIAWAPTGPPAVVNGVLYVPADRQVVSFDASSATRHQALTEFATFTTGATVELRPVAATVAGRAAVLITDAAGGVIALDADSRLPAGERQLASWNLGAPAAAEPVIAADGRTAFFALTEGRVVAIALDRPGTGLRWRHPAQGRLGSIPGPPALGLHALYVADAAGHLTAIDPASGEQRWQADLGGSAVGGVAAAAGRIYVPTVGQALLCFEEGVP